MASLSRSTKVCFLVAVPIIALLIVGAVSNLLNAGVCEGIVATWLSRDIMGGRPFYVVDGHSASPRSGNKVPDPAAIFKKLGAPLLTGNDPSKGEPFPWVSMRRVRCYWPFVVRVEYGFCHEPLIGEGGVKTYFCLFGRTVEIGDKTEWVS